MFRELFSSKASLWFSFLQSSLWFSFSSEVQFCPPRTIIQTKKVQKGRKSRGPTSSPSSFGSVQFSIGGLGFMFQWIQKSIRWFGRHPAPPFVSSRHSSWTTLSPWLPFSQIKRKKLTFIKKLNLLQNYEKFFYNFRL